LRFYQALKGDVVITGPYNTVSKKLNSGDKVSLITDKETKGDSKK
jgi:HlyD family secretion protein